MYYNFNLQKVNDVAFMDSDADTSYLLLLLCIVSLLGINRTEFLNVMLNCNFLRLDSLSKLLKNFMTARFSQRAVMYNCNSDYRLLLN